MDYIILKRLIFQQYNRAKQVKLFEQGRVNRALGIVLSSQYVDTIQKYGTTVSRCNCPDAMYRDVFCKHRIAFMINYRVWENIQLMIERELFGA